MEEWEAVLIHANKNSLLRNSVDNIVKLAVVFGFIWAGDLEKILKDY